MLRLAVILSFLSSADGYGQLCQYLSVIIIVLSGVRILIFSNQKLDAGDFINPGYLLIAIIIPIVSTIAVLSMPPPQLNEFSIVLQGLLLFLVLTSFILHINYYGIYKIVYDFSVGFFVVVVGVAIFENNNLFDSLSFVETETGRVRFSPFLNHPNLTGHIFSVASINFVLMIFRRQSLFKEKLTWAFFALISVIYVMAASSRGSFVGLVLAIFVAFFIYIKNISPIKRSKILFKLLISTVIIFAYKFSEVLDWIFELFELNSDYRGVGSGGTGRFDNWTSVMDKVNDNTLKVFIGSGLRSWSDDYYGHATDSSYINSLWESGYFITLGVVLLFGNILYKIAIKKTLNIFNCYVAAIVTFVMIESIFARYMIAVGNPGSLLVLMIVGVNFNKLIEDK